MWSGTHLTVTFFYFPNKDLEYQFTYVLAPCVSSVNKCLFQLSLLLKFSKLKCKVLSLATEPVTWIYCCPCPEMFLSWLFWQSSFVQLHLSASFSHIIHSLSQQVCWELLKNSLATSKVTGKSIVGQRSQMSHSRRQEQGGNQVVIIVSLPFILGYGD